MAEERRARRRSDAPCVVCVDLGATYCRLALATDDDLGPVVVRRTAELSGDADQTAGIVPALVALIERVASEEGSPGAVRAAGVGVAGFVDASGSVLAPTPFGVPDGFLLRDRLAETLGVPVVIDNDAKLAALGELTHGAGRGVADFVLVTLGTNIGGAIVTNGVVRRGAHGVAGEVGMLLVPVRPEGVGPIGEALDRSEEEPTADTPAYVYIEQVAGGRALARACLPARGGSASRDVFADAAGGDQAAQAAVARVIEAWAVLLADIAVCLDPGLVILSGGLVLEARHFIEPLRRRVALLTPFPPHILVGSLGASAGLVGAAVAARRVIGTREARQSKEAHLGSERPEGVRT